MKKVGIALLVLLVLVGGFAAWFYTSHDLGQKLGPQPGSPAPEVALVDLQGQAIRIADFRAAGGNPGSMVVLSFWSPTCPTGKRNLDAYAELARWCREHQVRFFAVDSYGDTAERAVALAKEHGVDYPVLMDESTAAARALGARTVTLTYVIDREGRVRYRGGLTNRKTGAERTLPPLVAAQELLDGKEVAEPKFPPFG